MIQITVPYWTQNVHKKQKDSLCVEKLNQLPCELFLQGFQTSLAFLRAKQVGENRVKFQNPGKIAIRP